MRIDRLSSFLYELAKTFLAIEEFGENEFEVKKYLLQKLEKQGEDYLFAKAMNLAKDYVSKLKYDTPIFSIRGEILGLEFFHYDLRGCAKPIEEVSNTQAVYRIKDFLVKFFIDLYNIEVNKTQNLKVIDKTLDNFLDKFDINGFISTLEKSDSDENILILCEYYSLRILTGLEKIKYYFKFRDYFFKHIDKLDDSARSDFFIALETFCIRNLETPDADLLPGLFELYKEHLRMIPKDIGNSSIFINYVQYGVMLNKSEHIEKFIEVEKSRLPANVREEIVKRGLAEIAFKKKEFEKSLKYLLNIPRTTGSSEDWTRILYIKIYYELNHFDEVYSSIDSFRHYLKLSKLSDKARERKYLLALKYITKLLKLKIDNNKSEAGLLIKKINQEKENIRRADFVWLMEKAKELCN